MRSKTDTHSEEAEKAVRDIRRATRRQFAAEEKIRIVIAGLRGEDSVAELCRKEGINQNLYYRWSKDFLEAGKKRLAGDSAREATSDEVKELRAETHQLKELLAELMMENRVLKKSALGDGEADRDCVAERGGFEPSRLFRMSRGAVAHHPGDRGWPITRIPRSTLAVAVMSSFKLCSQREKSPWAFLSGASGSLYVSV
jgi:transposase